MGRITIMKVIDTLPLGDPWRITLEFFKLPRNIGDYKILLYPDSCDVMMRLLLEDDEFKSEVKNCGPLALAHVKQHFVWPPRYASKVICDEIVAIVSRFSSYQFTTFERFHEDIKFEIDRVYELMEE
jgi:hypothetical protein